MIPHIVHDLATVGILAVTNTTDQNVKNFIHDGFALDLNIPSGTEVIQREKTTILLDLQRTLDELGVGRRPVY